MQLVYMALDAAAMAGVFVAGAFVCKWCFFGEGEKIPEEVSGVLIEGQPCEPLVVVVVGDGGCSSSESLVLAHEVDADGR